MAELTVKLCDHGTYPEHGNVKVEDYGEGTVAMTVTTEEGHFDAMVRPDEARALAAALVHMAAEVER